MSIRIRKGDRVVAITGSYKGIEGEVIKVLPKINKALVRGINVAKKHQRQTANQKGGKMDKELPISLSNIAMIDPQSGEPTRVGYRFNDDGVKIRYAKRSGEIIDG